MDSVGSFPKGNWPGHEADYSHPSSAKVWNAWNYTSTPPYVFMVWYLVKQQICLYGVVVS